jgi:hypothetical protein
VLQRVGGLVCAACALSPPGVPPVSAEQRQEAQLTADAEIERASWLCKIMARLVRKYAVAHVSGQLISGRVMQSLTSLAWQVVEGTVTLLDPVYFDNMDAAFDAVEKD